MMPIKAAWSMSLVLLGASWGCAIAPLPGPPIPPSPSAPFFHATPEDITQLTLVAAELDIAAAECASAETCTADVHFSRALVSLFENREAARASFEEVMSLYPSSPLAGPSALWLQLLHDEAMSSVSDDPRQRILTEVSAHWAREWIGRRLAVSPRSGKKDKLLTPVATQALMKQLQEKDRHINELRFQLEALKVIDQDQQDRQDRHRKVKTPKIESHR